MPRDVLDEATALHIGGVLGPVAGDRVRPGRAERYVRPKKSATSVCQTEDEALYAVREVTTEFNTVHHDSRRGR